MIERTFGMIKPDAVAAGKIGAIIQYVEGFNLTPVRLEMKQLTRGQAAGLYAVHAGKDFFDGLVEFTCSGPVVLMAIKGSNAIARYRWVVENVLRPTFGTSVRHNAAHGSDSPDAARAELAIFFPGLAS